METATEQRATETPEYRDGVMTQIASRIASRLEHESHKQMGLGNYYPQGVLRQYIRGNVLRQYIRGNVGYSDSLTIRRPVAPPRPPNRAQIQPTALDPGCDEEYRALARSLGVCDPAAVNAELEAFLAQSFIEIYPLESVLKYMDELCTAASSSLWNRLDWDWYPLRVQDAAGVNLADWDLGERLYNADGKKPVPLPVLQTVKFIADQFGSQVRFCVTDVERIPDPFLGVGAATNMGVLKMHVIERWDEPKYRP